MCTFTLRATGRSSPALKVRIIQYCNQTFLSAYNEIGTILSTLNSWHPSEAASIISQILQTRELGGYLPKLGSAIWSCNLNSGVLTSHPVFFPLGHTNLKPWKSNQPVGVGLPWWRYIILLVHNHRIMEVIEFVLCLQAGQTRNHSWHMQIHLVFTHTRRDSTSGVWRRASCLALTLSHVLGKGESLIKITFYTIEECKTDSNAIQICY